MLARFVGWCPLVKEAINLKKRIWQSITATTLGRFGGYFVIVAIVVSGILGTIPRCYSVPQNTSNEQQVHYDLIPDCIQEVKIDRSKVHCVLEGTLDKPTGIQCDPYSFIVEMKEHSTTDKCFTYHVVRKEEK